jgi:hypothetical protein
MVTQAADGREDKQIDFIKLHYGNSPTYYADRIIERSSFLFVRDLFAYVSTNGLNCTAARIARTASYETSQVWNQRM